MSAFFIDSVMVDIGRLPAALVTMKSNRDAAIKKESVLKNFNRGF